MPYIVSKDKDRIVNMSEVVEIYARRARVARPDGTIATEPPTIMAALRGGTDNSHVRTCALGVYKNPEAVISWLAQKLTEPWAERGAIYLPKDESEILPGAGR